MLTEELMKSKEHKKLGSLIFPVLFVALLILAGPNNLAAQAQLLDRARLNSAACAAQYIGEAA